MTLDKSCHLPRVRFPNGSQKQVTQLSRAPTEAKGGRAYGAVCGWLIKYSSFLSLSFSAQQLGHHSSGPLSRLCPHCPEQCLEHSGSVREDARLRPPQLLQHNTRARGLINKTLFLTVPGGGEQNKASGLGALTRASIPPWAPPS